MSKKNMLILYFSHAIVGLVSTLTVFISSLQVYEYTGSTISTSLIWIVYLIATLISHLFSGPLIDKYSKKSLMMYSEIIKLLIFIITLIILLFFSESFTVYIVFLLVILLGLIEPIYRPSSLTYIKTITPQQYLIKINSRMETIIQSAMLLGPALGGILILYLDFEIILILICLILFLNTFILTFLPYDKIKSNFDKSLSWFGEVKQGFVFYKKEKVFIWIVSMIFLVNIGSGGIQSMIIPYADQYLDANESLYGILASSVALGMLLGSLIASFISSKGSKSKIMTISLALSGIFLTLYGVSNSVIIAIIILSFFGISVIIFNINNTTLYQKLVPSNIMGRVFIIRGLLAKISVPIGAFLAGISGNSIGIDVFYIVSGFSVTLLCIYLLLSNKLSSVD